MKWFLVLAAMTTTLTLIGQSTLKIYVVTDDSRSDMVIIDLNTSAIDEYGQSVDSTNMNYYTPTMSTQVVRLSYEELYGSPETEEVVSAIVEDETKLENPILDDPVASNTAILETVGPRTRPVSQTAKSISQSNAVRQTPSTSFSRPSKNRDYNPSRDTKKRSKKKRIRLKKSLKSKRYRGQCPKFS